MKQIFPFKTCTAEQNLPPGIHVMILLKVTGEIFKYEFLNID